MEEAVIERCVNEYYNLNTIGIYKDDHVGVRPLDETKNQKKRGPVTSPFEYNIFEGTLNNIMYNVLHSR